jgi:hypothetical protein
MKTRSIAVVALVLTVTVLNSLSQFATAEIPTKETQGIDRLEAVQMGEKYGFVDRDGRIAIEAKYQNATDFVEGLAAVKINGKWGYIDRAGNLIIGSRFDRAMSFANGKAKVKLKDRWGSIDRNGRFVPAKA